MFVVVFFVMFFVMFFVTFFCHVFLAFSLLFTVITTSQNAGCATEAFSTTCAVHVEDCEGW